jgi:hypothetical protein
MIKHVYHWYKHIINAIYDEKKIIKNEKMELKKLIKQMDKLIAL